MRLSSAEKMPKKNEDSKVNFSMMSGAFQTSKMDGRKSQQSCDSQCDVKSGHVSAPHSPSGAGQPALSVNAHDLICQLTGMPVVDQDAILLINANEVLAKDGIHGKIA